MKMKKAEEALIAAHVETVSHCVLRDGVPCKLVNVSGMRRGGVLVPGTPIISFTKSRDAQRAIDRTLRVREIVRTSLVSEWVGAQMPSLLDGETFEILPIGRQT